MHRTITERAASWSAAHWKTAVAGWLAIMVGAIVAGQLVGARELTPREREVLTLMAEGRTNAGIAESMVVTTGAVEKHIASIFSKLHLHADGDSHRRVLAVLAWLHDSSA